MKKLSILFAISMLFAFSLTNALAYHVSVGDQIYFYRFETAGSGPGGEFSIHLYNNGAVTPKLFESFCVEHTEYITLGPSHGYYIGGISNAAIKGGTSTSDTLDTKTAYLFQNWYDGNLKIGYLNNNTDANALQNAIWYIEGEISSLPTGRATDYYNEAVTYANGSLYGVQVLNMYSSYNSSTGEYSGLAQDQLVVPEPGILILLGIAMSAIGAASWRLRKL